MVWYVGGGLKEHAGIQALEVELARASDRAAAILAGSLVEARLTAFLKSHVRDDGKVWKDRTHSSAPLGSFAIKIDLAFLFHLITKEAHSDLIVMKNIRNQFAHELNVQDFETRSIKDRCANLKLVDIYVKNDEALSMYRVVSGAPPDAITGNDFTFHVGGAGAREELDDPRKRYIWSTKVFNIAFGFPPVPRYPPHP